MFGYYDPLRSCRYVGGTMQSFCWKILKWFAVFILLIYAVSL